MARQVFDFEWLVHKGGYVWAFDPNSGRRIIRPKPVVVSNGDATAPIRRYRPLKPSRKGVTTLFQAFATTEPTEDGIAGFASAHGLLTIAHFPVVSEPGVGSRLLTPVTDGEPLELWRAEISAVRRAVEVWGWVRDRNVAALKRHIKWSGTPGKRTLCFVPGSAPTKRTRPYKPGSRREDGELIAYETSQPRDAKLFHLNDVVTPAVFYLKGLVDLRLNGLTGSGDPSGGMGAEMAWDVETKALYLRFRPNSLLVGIWAQFGRALTGDVVFRQCGACPNLFEVSPGGSRSSRRYCSDPCRFKLFRGRQRRASELYAEGKAVSAIAAELDTDVETVEGWIQAKRSKP